MTITLECDPARLDTYTDQFLAALWHANEASVAAFGDGDAEGLGDSLAREMARRFLVRTAPSMWKRQTVHHYEAVGLLVSEKEGGAL